jgi:hypothetical protein
MTNALCYLVDAEVKVLETGMRRASITGSRIALGL